MKVFWNSLARSYLKRFQGISLPLVMSGFALLWVIVSYWVLQWESSAEGANIKTFEDSLWWGVVSYLTVGYGDRYPVTLMGRLLGMVLMFGGVLVTSLITAKISAVFFEAALSKGRGRVDTELLKDHFVICGWSDDMEALLLHILDLNAGLKSDHVVVIANADENRRDSIWSNPRLSEIGFIVGDYFTEAQLRRAAPEKARKVLILADRTSGPNGQNPTPVEIDARTIMTSMTLSNIARGTLIAAEVLDHKMTQYLKIAGVSEIIYSREYSRLLLGNASGGTGVVNILYDLLDPSTPSKISTVPLPTFLFGKSYHETKVILEQNNPNLCVVGVLENYGSQQTIKEQALRKAQLTPDIHQLVTNLQGVRDIRCNNPIFNPPSNFLLKEGTLLIVIENRHQGVSHGPTGSQAQSRVA